MRRLDLSWIYCEPYSLDILNLGRQRSNRFKSESHGKHHLCRGSTNCRSKIRNHLQSIGIHHQMLVQPGGMWLGEVLFIVLEKNLLRGAGRVFTNGVDSDRMGGASIISPREAIAACGSDFICVISVIAIPSLAIYTLLDALLNLSYSNFTTNFKSDQFVGRLQYV